MWSLSSCVALPHSTLISHSGLGLENGEHLNIKMFSKVRVTCQNINLVAGKCNCCCCCRRCGQVQTQTEISAASHHLGRRGDSLLLQGEVQELSEGNV